MTTIQEKINADLKTAMLEKNEAKKSLLRVIIGEFNRVGKEVDDSKATSILKKMLENAKEQNNIGEVTIINEYLPQELTQDQVKAYICQLVRDKGYTSIKDMGKLMSDLKAELAGRYDAKFASDYIKSYLPK